MPQIAELIDAEKAEALAAAAQTRTKIQQALIAKVNVNEPSLIDPERQFCLITCQMCQKDSTHKREDLIAKFDRKSLGKNGYTCDDCTTNPLKEKPVLKFDISNMSDAELGKMVRNRILETYTVEVAEKRDEALEVKAAEDKAEAKARKKAQKARATAEPLPEIRVSDSLTVPELVLNEVNSLDEVVNSAMRSPYNKALFRLRLQEQALNPETTTYAVLVKAHNLIFETVAARDTEKACKKSKKAVVVAEVSTDEKAKIKALRATVPGLTKAQAREILATL